MSTSYWMGVCCETPRDKTALKSWFGQFWRDEWSDPICAESLDDAETDRPKKLAVAFKNASGDLMQITRTFGRRTCKITVSRPTKRIADLAGLYARRQPASSPEEAK